VKHAIVDLHTSPLFTDYIFYPVGLSLVFYTLALFNGLVTIPIQFFAGPITTNNVVLILSLTLSAFGAYLLVKELLGRHFHLLGQQECVAAGRMPAIPEHPRSGQEFAAMDTRHMRAVAAGGQATASDAIFVGAFVGGLVYAFPASRFVYASLGQANLSSTAWLPFFVLYLIRAVHAAQDGKGTEFSIPALRMRGQLLWPWYSFMAGLFLLFAVLTELTYGAFLGIFAASYLLAALLTRGWGLAALGRLAGSMAIITGVFLIGFSPVLIPAIQESSAGYTGEGWGGADRFSADLLSFFIPSRLHPILGQQATIWSASLTDLPIVYIGFGVLGLTALAIYRFRHKLAFWWLSALGYMVLSLGPVLHVNGVSQFDFDGLKVRIALPFILLHYVPLIKANRVPNRFSIMTTLCLAVPVGFAVAWLLVKVISGRRSKVGPLLATTTAVILAGVVLFEHLSAPLPLTYAVAPDVYRQIAQDDGDFAILQLPLGWRNSYGIQGAEKTILESYQAVHGKRILGGNTSRNPESTFRYFAEVPLFSSIIALEEGRPLEAGALQRDREMAASLLTFYDLRYLVVHRDYVDPVVEQYVLAVLPAEKFYEEGNVVAYRLATQPRQESGVIDLGTAAAAMNRGEGWGRDETAAGGITVNWATQRHATLFFAVSEPADTRLTLRLIPFVYAGMPKQTMEVVVNGSTIQQVDLEADWRDYAFALPRDVLHAGINRLDLRFGQIASPSVVMDSTDRRNLAAAVDFVQWEKAR
jgi:hypothetical protein